MTTNVERTEWGRQSLDEYMSCPGAAQDDATALSDLIGDLLHLAGRLPPNEDFTGIPPGVDIGDFPFFLLARAIDNYLCELDEDEEGKAPMEVDQGRVTHLLAYLGSWLRA